MIGAFDHLEGRKPRRVAVNAPWWNIADAPSGMVTVGKAANKRGDERSVQRPIVRAFRLAGFFVHHSPNGAHLAGATPRQRAAKWGGMLGDGCVPGFPDLLLCADSRRVGFIEVKVPGEEWPEDQRAVAFMLHARGLPVACVCDLDGALAAVRSWGWPL